MSKFIVQQLKIEPGYVLAIINAPKNYRSVYKEISDNVGIDKELRGKYDFIQYFVKRLEDLKKDIYKISNALKTNGSLWIAYPKTNELETNLTSKIIAEEMNQNGFYLISQINLDQVWTAIRVKKFEE